MNAKGHKIQGLPSLQNNWLLQCNNEDRKCTLGAPAFFSDLVARARVKAAFLRNRISNCMKHKNIPSSSQSIDGLTSVAFKIFNLILNGDFTKSLHDVVNHYTTSSSALLELWRICFHGGWTARFYRSKLCFFIIFI